MAVLIQSPRFSIDAAHPITRARSIYTDNRRRSVSLDPSRFIVISAVLATALVGAISLFKIHGGHIPTIQLAELQLDNMRLGEVVPRNRNSFLAQLSRDDERRVAAQIHYVSNIIRSHRKRAVGVERLALSIVQESTRMGVDPLFVAAIIKSESTFNAHARSNVGAMGLMQVMPATGQHVSKMIRASWQGEQKLSDPRYNMELGITYIKHLIEMFDGNQEHALIAYNWGPGNLIRALKERGSIPSSPVAYAKGILSNHKKWKNDLSTRPAQYQYFDTRSVRG